MTIDVLQPGIQTTVQDFPGRVGFMDRGFFPAGPMDDLSFQLSNGIVGNSASAAGLEVTLGNLTLQFTEAAEVCVTGADLEVTLDGGPVEMWSRVHVGAGQTLRLGIARGPGFRAYVAVRGGVDVPTVLGSRATYTMGSLGGVEGRALRKGDVLRVGTADSGRAAAVDYDRLPDFTHDWVLEVVPGPHASAEFLTNEDLDLLFTKEWSIDRNSNRTGVRLEPQRLRWARSDGGIAGGHPSNILDTGYPLGGINLNGDTPVILGPDGPTSGGFVVFAVVTRSSMWKLGQMRPGTDRVTLRSVSLEEAACMRSERDKLIANEGRS